MSPAGQPLADFGARFLAYLIDSAILTVAALIVAVGPAIAVLLALLPRLTDGTDPYAADPVTPALFFLIGFGVELGILVVTLGLAYLYYVEAMYRSGQTVGKKAMKIRVIPLDPRAVLTRGTAAKRYLIQFVPSAFVPFFGLLDGLWQLWDKPFQQTLHDKVAQTVVIKVLP
jgi:uncharacterized RDD family membrane protein YckC